MNTPNGELDLSQWLSYIESCHPADIDLGLTRINTVGNRGQLLTFSCPIITVAGTNGKGSTVAILAWLLKAAGLRVGSYTSPHLIHFKERIQINGQCLSDADLCQAFATIEELRQDVALTFFEFTTLAALVLFQRAQPQLDVIILEVGLGGRLDAVNAVTPNIAVITAIGFDHQDLLGDTLEKIGAEKAGILRQGIPTVIGSKAAIPSIMAKAAELSNRVYQEGIDFSFDENRQIWQGQNVTIQLGQHHLPKNSVSLTLATYTILDEFYFTLPALNDVVDCLDSLAMIGRFQTFLWNGKLVIFDVAHNSQAAQWLADKIQALVGNKKGIAVWASLADKALDEIVVNMKECIDRWYIGLVNQKREASVEHMQQVLVNHHATSIMSKPTILDAFTQALQEAREEDFIVVFGSFYTVAPILAALNFDEMIFQDQGLYKNMQGKISHG